MVGGTEDSAHGVARTLSHFGSVTHVFRACDAEDLLDRRWCAAVFDIARNNTSGLEVARRLRESSPTTPILFLMTEAAPEFVAEAYELDATLLEKPATSMDLRLFACRAQSRRSTVTGRIIAVAMEWSMQYELSRSETEVLRLVALGHERAALPELREVAPCTIKKQVNAILRKTGDPTLDAAITRLLRVTLNRSA